MSPCMSHGVKCPHACHMAVNVTKQIFMTQTFKTCVCGEANFQLANYHNISFLNITSVRLLIHPLGASRLSQHVHIVNITSVRLLIAPFGRVAAFTTCPHCQYYQCSSLNRTLWTRCGFHNMSTLSIITSVRLLIACFGLVTAFTTFPHCQYYQCSSLNLPPTVYP